jgi:hypothetical protein
MNPIIADFIKSTVRYLLGGLAFWLGKKGIIEQDLGTQLVELAGASVVTFVTLHWAYVSAVFRAYLVKAASHLPNYATPDEIAAKAHEMKQDDKFVVQAATDLPAFASPGQVVAKAIELKQEAMPNAPPTITPGVKAEKLGLG